jgi:hypothetical protein
MPASVDSYRLFLSLSAELTGFDRVNLEATGLARFYFHKLAELVGAEATTALETAWHQVEQCSHEKPEQRSALTRSLILDDQHCGPVARNLLILWYLGQWDPLPSWWYAEYGHQPPPESLPCIIFKPECYTEGLVWPAAGAHPPGAKPFGYAVWTQPPVEPEL